jgi:hypothetical protein
LGKTLWKNLKTFLKHLRHTRKFKLAEKESNGIEENKKTGKFLSDQFFTSFWRHFNIASVHNCSLYKKNGKGVECSSVLLPLLDSYLKCLFFCKLSRDFPHTNKFSTHSHITRVLLLNIINSFFLLFLLCLKWFKAHICK